MADIVLISDPRVTSIPVEDIGEPLVDLRGRFAVDTRLADEDGAYAHLREGLATRLEEAQRLLPRGYRLLIVEGYRPPALQRRYFEEYKAELRAAFPEMTPEELHAAASRYVSPDRGGPAHRGCRGRPHPVHRGRRRARHGHPRQRHTRAERRRLLHRRPGISAEARRNREILATALRAAGLINYPTEWWHWSYGDRYWAMSTGTPAALYGPAEF